ncbi:Band 7 protein [Fasciola gigantica]|uniref:Band 7 protein n=1 Tax=Fasciola gigantica TaxID=46835 RepID=A0A504Z6U8_FASGI|nr:Band 7 protein [Fasciola gigantica]
MQRAMAAEAQATRAACAKVIAAKGELDSAHMLQQAAQTMSGTPAALQLRYLQTLATIATEQNSTIIFPLPIELMSALTSRNK